MSQIGNRYLGPLRINLYHRRSEKDDQPDDTTSVPPTSGAGSMPIETDDQVSKLYQPYPTQASFNSSGDDVAGNGRGAHIRKNANAAPKLSKGDHRGIIRPHVSGKEMRKRRKKMLKRQAAHERGDPERVERHRQANESQAYESAMMNQFQNGAENGFEFSNFNYDPQQMAMGGGPYGNPGMWNPWMMGGAPYGMNNGAPNNMPGQVPYGYPMGMNNNNTGNLPAGGIAARNPYAPAAPVGGAMLPEYESAESKEGTDDDSGSDGGDSMDDTLQAIPPVAPSSAAPAAAAATALAPARNSPTQRTLAEQKPLHGSDPHIAVNKNAPFASVQQMPPVLTSQSTAISSPMNLSTTNGVNSSKPVMIRLGNNGREVPSTAPAPFSNRAPPTTGPLPSANMNSRGHSNSLPSIAAANSSATQADAARNRSVSLPGSPSVSTGNGQSSKADNAMQGTGNQPQSAPNSNHASPLGQQSHKLNIRGGPFANYSFDPIVGGSGKGSSAAPWQADLRARQDPRTASRFPPFASNAPNNNNNSSTAAPPTTTPVSSLTKQDLKALSDSTPSPAKPVDGASALKTAGAANADVVDSSSMSSEEDSDHDESHADKETHDHDDDDKESVSSSDDSSSSSSSSSSDADSDDEHSHSSAERSLVHSKASLESDPKPLVKEDDAAWTLSTMIDLLPLMNIESEEDKQKRLQQIAEAEAKAKLTSSVSRTGSTYSAIDDDGVSKQSKVSGPMFGSYYSANASGYGDMGSRAFSIDDSELSERPWGADDYGLSDSLMRKDRQTAVDSKATADDATKKKPEGGKDDPLAPKHDSESDHDDDKHGAKTPGEKRRKNRSIAFGEEDEGFGEVNGGEKHAADLKRKESAAGGGGISFRRSRLNRRTSVHFKNDIEQRLDGAKTVEPQMSFYGTAAPFGTTAALDSLYTADWSTASFSRNDTTPIIVRTTSQLASSPRRLSSGRTIPGSAQ